MGDVLVIGYGNELRSDDAAGRHVAQRLADDPRLVARGAVVLDRRQLTPELALDASEARLLVLVDASTRVAPGEVEVRRLEPREASDRSAWSHHMDPAALVTLSAELYGKAPEAWIVTVGVASIEVAEQLSAEVAAALPRAVEAVVDLLMEHADA